MNPDILNTGSYRRKALSLALLLSIAFELLMPFSNVEAASVGEAFTFSAVGSSSWTVPSGVTSIKVMAWGGGGAGGSGEKIDESNRSGLGGGAGGYVEKTFSVTPGDSFDIVVGAGGQGIGSVWEGRVGRSGGETRFEGNGTTMVAAGGTGGASFTGEANPIEPIGMGGAASGGDRNETGGNGGSYSEIDDNPYASSGGSAYNGGQGGSRGRCGRDGHCPGSEVGSALAQDGGFPGGGGGGSDVAEGGYGANGQVIIEVASIAAVNQGPVGYLDSATCSSFVGWAYDASNSSVSTGVHFYTEDAGGNLVFIGNTEANQPREDVNTNMGVDGDHGFTFALPDSLKDGQTHKIYAYGLDTDGGENTMLTGSGMEVTGCTGSGGNPTQTIANITTSVGTCSAPGVPMSFTVNVSGPNVISIALEKDTNGDDVWGQVGTWNAAGAYAYTSNELSDYTGTYRLRLVVNGAVLASKEVSINANCGGGGNTAISGAINTSVGTCSVAGAPMTFSVAASGSNINSVVLEKDTNGDGSWGQVGSWGGAGTYSYTSNEPTSYTGTYSLRLLINNSVITTRNVSVQANCGGGGPQYTKPSITQFDITPLNLTLGQTQSWVGNAVKGSENISRYRAYVVGSTGGTWTTATNPNAVSFNLASVSTTQNPAIYHAGAGAYTVRFEVEDVTGQVTSAERTVNVSPSANNAAISTTAPSCVAPGTLLSFNITIGQVNGPVTLEKDTNGDNVWGQVAAYGQGNHTFLSSESAAYTGLYRLRLLVGSEVVDTENVNILADCSGANQGRPIITSFDVNPSSVVIGQTQSWSGNAVKGSANIARYRAYVVGSTGGTWTTATNPNAVSFNNPAVSTTQNPASFYNGAGAYTVRFEVEDVNGLVSTMDRPATITTGGGGGGNNITASITTTAPSCVPAGTNIPFMVNVSGSGVTSIVLEKDTNNDAVFGQVASWPDARNRSFVSAEDAAYTGIYTLRLIVNGTVSDTRSVTVGACSNSTFTVTPLTGLTTTESGGTANFTVVLNAAPNSNVTLPIVSSNTNEGTVSPSVLTFTPGNWSTTQTVTVTGRDDSAQDGNVSYTVLVGPSQSSDVNANGMAAQQVTIVNNDNESASSGGSGGGGGSRSGGRSSLRCTGFGCPTTTATTTSTTGLGDIIILFDQPTYTAPAVTGPELVCPKVNFLTTFLKIDTDNNPNEVRKLQYFLNVYEGANLAIDGVFDVNTENAVKALQAKYADEILSPWGVTEPTGVVYITTTRHINTVYCGDNPGYMGNEDISDIIDNSVLYPEIDNSGDFEGEIGSATSTDSNLNLAGVGSISSRIWNGLKDIPLYLILILVLMVTGAGIILSNVLKKDASTHAVYVSLIRGAAVLAIATVLNVLNTVSYILNPEWFTSKSGFTLGWLLALNAINLGIIIAICLAVLISLYGMLARVRN